MTRLFDTLSSWRLLPVAAAALLAACGGGETGVADNAATAANPARESAKALTTATVDANATLDWAQYKYPTLFPKGPTSVPFNYLGVDYTVRIYSTGNALGITKTGAVFGLGPFNGNVLTPYGKISDYAGQIVADQCAVDASNCPVGGGGGGSGGGGTLNGCALGASQVLVTGNRFKLDYRYFGAINGTVSNEGVVNGAASFEGQSAIQTTVQSVASTTVQSFSTTQTSQTKSYQQAAAGDLIRTLGNEIEAKTPDIVVGNITVPGQTTRTRVVYNPAFLNTEFTISLGQSITTSLTSTTTTLESPIPIAPTTTTLSTAHTYEARETITVPAGTFEACRYKQVTAGTTTTSWYRVGKGLLLKQQTVTDTQNSGIELTAGSLNGGPL